MSTEDELATMLCSYSNMRTADAQLIARIVLHGGYVKPRLVSNVEELLMLPIETVLRGPDFNGEVYQKFDDVEFSSISGETSWLASSLAPRGPFTIIWEPTK